MLEKKKGKRTENSERRENIRKLISDYGIETLSDIKDAIKDLLGETIKEMMELEMDEHIGSSKNERNVNRDNYRNGYKSKKVISEYGDIEIDVPQDRNSTYNSALVPKRSKDINDIDKKIISLYARGMSTRDISAIIDDLYGFEVDESFVSRVTDKIISKAEEWQNRPLDSKYAMIFIDATYFSVREEGKVTKKAAYVILGVSMDGKKEVLSIEIGENESSKYWHGVLNTLKARGVKDIFIIASDRLKGIKDAIEAVYPNSDWQGCIVHQIRNTLKFVSYKHRKEYAKDLKSIYQAINEEQALKALDEVKEKWNKFYHGSMDSWYDNWDNIAPMYSYGENLRRLVYTTNAIESLNSSYKKFNKSRPVFPSKLALFKALYLVTDIVSEKWTTPIRDWGLIYSDIIAIFGRDRVEN